MCKCLSSSVFGRNYWEHRNNTAIRYLTLIYLHRFWIVADIFIVYANDFLFYSSNFFFCLCCSWISPQFGLYYVLLSPCLLKKKSKKNYYHNPCLFLSNLVRRETRQSPNSRCEKLNWNWKELGVNSTKGLTFSPPPCTPNQILRFVNKCVKYSMDWEKGCF